MYEKTVLPNGLRLITSSFPHTRSVSLAVFVAAGPRFEKPNLAGVSHFVEHLCFKGTERWPSAQLVSEAIEGVGGILNGGTDKEITVYWCKVAQTHFQLALDLLTDLVRSPKMDPADTDRERSIIIEELHMCLDSPQSRVDQIADELLWPGQHLGRDIAGSEETVGGMAHESIREYFSQRYLPNNAVVSIAGNISREQVEQAVGNAFGSWGLKQSPAAFKTDTRQDAPRLRVEHRDTEQVNLCLAVQGISSLDPDRFKLDLLNAVLGEGMSSRLFAEIREKRCLAYDIHSAVSHFTDAGSLNVYAGVDPPRFNETVSAVLEQLDRLKSDIPEVELNKAREMSKGRLLLRMEDTRNVVAWLGSQEMISGHVLTPDDVVSILDKITTDQLKETARRLLVKEHLSLAAVGPIHEKDLPTDILKL
ncbi:MAG: insulinase family protein [Chloroflexi bacterium]|nr:insulinase family protein [Chloroflexota bacterium]